MDTVGRWGGDEFLIILDTHEIDKIKEIFERIKQNIENTSIKYNNDVFSLSATVGVTIFEPNINHTNDELEVILEKADKSLYEGKKSGESGQVIYYNIA